MNVRFSRITLINAPKINAPKKIGDATMRSFLEAAKVRKSGVVPAGGFSAIDLSREFRLSFPMKLSTLCRCLDPVTKAYSSGIMGPSTTTGHAEFFINSAGFWLFQGHIREDGLVGHHYTFAVALDFLDQAGIPIATAFEGEIHAPFGTRVSDFSKNGQLPIIAENWDIVKSRGAQFNLIVSTDPVDLVTVLSGIPIIVGIGIGVGFVIGGLLSGDPNTRCQAGPAGDNTGAGAELRCRREFQ